MEYIQQMDLLIYAFAVNGEILMDCESKVRWVVIKTEEDDITKLLAAMLITSERNLINTYNIAESINNKWLQDISTMEVFINCVKNCRYTDTFVVWPHGPDTLQPLHQRLIQITIEEDKDDKFSLLHVLMI